MLKPFLTYEQQLAKLRDEKHLVISDEESASNKLKHIGYYSLNNFVQREVPEGDYSIYSESRGSYVLFGRFTR